MTLKKELLRARLWYWQLHFLKMILRICSVQESLMASFIISVGAVVTALLIILILLRSTGDLLLTASLCFSGPPDHRPHRTLHADFLFKIVTTVCTAAGSAAAAAVGTTAAAAGTV